jgi:citronellol/citronellal dehydrogenase
MPSGTLENRTLLITGASRGIGEAIALRAARDGARVVLLGKSERPHPKLPGTLGAVAEKVEAAGGSALVCRCDIRETDQITAAVERTVEVFGAIDVVVNNASAIFLAGTADTPMKRYDLMQSVNVRGTFAVTRACLPYLESSDNPHVLNIAPPLNFEERWFAPHVAYTISKYGMSLCVLGMAGEFRKKGIAVNALWPRTTIATAAVNMLGGEALMQRSRKPSIMGDAAHAILVRDSRACTGNFFIDDDVLREAGVENLGGYAVDPDSDLEPDFFV